MPTFRLLGLTHVKPKIPRAYRALADNFALAELDEPHVQRLKLNKTAQKILRKCIRDAYLEGWVTSNVEHEEQKEF